MNYMSGGIDLAKAYALLHQKQKALEVINATWKDAQQYASYYVSLNGSQFDMSQRDCMIQLSILSQVAEVTVMVDAKLAAQQRGQIDQLYRLYVGKGGQMMEN
jgi:hypothetical protein